MNEVMDEPVFGKLEQRLGQLHARRFEESAQLYERALAMREEKFGPDSWLVSFSLSRLGNLHQRWGRYADAESFSAGSGCQKENCQS
jgi:hypothetical protein